MSTAHPDVRTLLAEALELLRATADRSDPLQETVLCLVESSELAARAADQRALREVLAATRAAMVTASYALVEDRDQR